MNADTPITRANQSEGHELVLVTGPSGAGRSTAINALEDLGYEVIDNLPLSLVPRLVEGPPVGPIALGLDIRNRDFAATALIELIDRLTRNPDVSLDVLYIDCSAEELSRRYNQTRRRHPLGEAPAEAIAREVDLLTPVRVRADNLIDTTEMSPHDLKAEIVRWYAPDQQARMSVAVQSFSYKRGVPRGVDMIFDCRFLNNPHWVAQLREMDGRDAAVVDHIRRDPNFEEFFTRVRDLVLFLLPAQLNEGKAHLTIGFGCTGGQHRSVALAEMLADVLAQEGWPVSKRHRELERRAAAKPPTQAG
ncbi:RNase adapter RapZ [Falsirhodobacter deserti]|uniref:RNase adapter RapZ n=1 Tax=Falsirhodobacter deserti TaxID=1365611 RepID=UPI001F4EEF49|nr:RNase adapter RapZ [Falsirhodobacter deserti]